MSTLSEFNFNHPVPKPNLLWQFGSTLRSSFDSYLRGRCRSPSCQTLSLLANNFRHQVFIIFVASMGQSFSRSRLRKGLSIRASFACQEYLRIHPEYFTSGLHRLSLLDSLFCASKTNDPHATHFDDL